ncbi:hypothetical protein FI667_g11508, partial [Globisporangium splendens]
MADSASAGSTSADGSDSIAFPVATTVPATSAPWSSPAPAPAAPSSPPDGSSSSSFRASNQGDNDSNDKFHGPSGSDCGSKSKGNSGSNKETPEEYLHRRRTTGSCSFYPSEFKECAEPRSCFDCLNYQIEGEKFGCMLTEYGRCVSVDRKYNASMDFRHFYSSNELALKMAGGSDFGSSSINTKSSGSSHGSSSSSSSSSSSYMVSYPPPKDERYQFRAENAEYCSANDAMCKKCRRTVFADFIDDLTNHSPSAYCLGERGCVCIAVCEERRDRPPPNAKDCIAKALAAQNKKPDKAEGVSIITTVLAVVGAIAIVAVIVMAVFKVRNRAMSRSRQGSSGDGNDSGPENAVTTPDQGSSPSSTTMVTMTSTTAASRVLNLFGWQTMREELINKERLRLAGVENVSPVKHSHVQFLGIEPSAPEIDHAVPTAPMAAMPGVISMSMASAPMVFSVRAMASAPSAPDFDDFDDFDDVDDMETL